MIDACFDSMGWPPARGTLEIAITMADAILDLEPATDSIHEVGYPGFDLDDFLLAVQPSLQDILHKHDGVNNIYNWDDYFWTIAMIVFHDVLPYLILLLLHTY